MIVPFKNSSCILTHPVSSVGLLGTNWGEGAESKASCQYLIGIHDPTSGVVKLHPVDHIFALAMQVLGREDDEGNNVKSEQPQHRNQERNALVMEFGRYVCLWYYFVTMVKNSGSWGAAL